VLDEEALRDRVLAWVRIRMPASPASPGQASPGQGSPSSVWKARFSWVGVNVAKVTQRTPVVAEFVGLANGEPDQSFTLMNTPVIEDTVSVTIGGEPWAVIDDLGAAPSEVTVQDAVVAPGTALAPLGDARVLTVTRESGVLQAGNGLRGARPPAGAPVFVSYAYGGGRDGNVGIGAIRTSPQLPAGFSVANPLPTWGGTDGETEEEGERAIPRYLQHRDRAVSRSDFRDIVFETPGVSLGRADVLPLVHPDFIGVPAPGVVTVLLVPNDPARPEAPEPDRLFLQAVCNYLEPRRVLTTEVHLRGPRYVAVWVAIGIDVEAGRDVAAVREDVKGAIREFLSPLRGGPEQKGWPLEKAVEDRELLARAARVNGVAKIRDVYLWSGSPTSIATIELQGLELPRLERLSVSVGPAEDLSAELSPAAPPPPVKRVPVPVLPATC
jgi:predicted phage baseplate assembly protein